MNTFLRHPGRPAGATTWFALLGLVTIPSIVAAEPTVNGRLDRQAPFRVLRVWGTHHEMGFAHGKLLREPILADINDMLRTYYDADPKQYDRDSAELLAMIDTPIWARDEINGMFEGMKSPDGQAPRLELANRPLTVDDLLLYNAGDVTRAFACSGFVVWGERAGEAGVIAGRNFDYLAFSRRVVEDQMVLIREPADKRRTATVTWPGYLGAFTGFNEGGVALFLHDGNGPRSPKTDGKYVPLTLTMAELLSAADADSARKLTADALKKSATPFSYIIRLVTPRSSDGKEPPAAVFRFDADGASELKTDGDLCITTNHYVGENIETSESSRNRYIGLQEWLKSETITSDVAWSALKAVASVSPGGGTLHSIVYFPQQRRMELSFSTYAGQLTPAPYLPPMPLDWNDLFPR